ncbi:diguanylate cyclase, partial [Acinetobacter baumannii]
EMNEVAAALNELVGDLQEQYLHSITDPLTNVYNSAFFKHQLSESIKKAHENGESMVLLFCDVDNFKKLNDSEGHVF